MVEFACEPDSRLADTVESMGVKGVRVHKGSYDILSEEDMTELTKVIDEHEPDIWGALPCTMWSTWQYINEAKGGEPFRNRLGGDREASKRMVAQYEDKADQVAQQGGRQAFEWPRWCTGWKETRRWQYIADRDLWVVDFDGCMLGMKNEKGQPVKKMWRVATDDPELAITLGMFTCRHSPGTHAKIAGQTTKTTAFYPQPMCDIIAQVWYGKSDVADEEQEGSSSTGDEKQKGYDQDTTEGTRGATTPDPKPGVQNDEQINDDKEHEAEDVVDASPCPTEAHETDRSVEDRAKRGGREKPEEKDAWAEVRQLLEKQHTGWKGQRAAKIGAMEGGVYLVLGAFTHGGITGITKATEGNRSIASAINQAFKKTRMQDKWAAVTVMHTPSVRIHSDNHNAPGSSNHIRAIAKEEGVKVWVEDKQGDVEIATGKEGDEHLRGYVEGAARAVVSFDPKKKHTILSESEDYWLITAYTPRGLGKLSAIQMAKLQTMGFPTPSGSHEMWESSAIEESGTPAMGNVETTDGEIRDPERAECNDTVDRGAACAPAVEEGASEWDMAEKVESHGKEGAIGLEGSGSESGSAWDEEEVVMDSTGPKRGRVISWEPAMGGVTVTAPNGTRLKPRSVNFVRTGIFLENPERFALNVVGIGEWSSRNGTAVQGFEYDANDGTIIVQVDNRSNEWVEMGEQDEAFRFIFSKRITRLRPRVRWPADVRIQPAKKGRKQRVTRISRGQIPPDLASGEVGPTMDAGNKEINNESLGEGAERNSGPLKEDELEGTIWTGRTPQPTFECRSLFPEGTFPEEVETEEQMEKEQETVDSGDEPDTEYESDAEGMLRPRGGADRGMKPPRLCRRRRCRECRSRPKGNASVPYLALATATLCNMCFIQKHPTFADKLVKFVDGNIELLDEEESEEDTRRGLGLGPSEDDTTMGSRTNSNESERGSSSEFWAMPCFLSGEGGEDEEIFAMVARPVTKAERAVNPKARASLDKEWKKLEDQVVWIAEKMRPWAEVQEEARRSGTTMHAGRIFDICVEKNHELPEDDPLRKYKGRVVFEGCNVKDQDNRWAIFQEITSCPATMEAGKMADAYGVMEGHTIEMADGESAYTQAELGGPLTWVRIPRERWPESWEGTEDPVCPLRLALYGHPDAGGFWEKHCEKAVTAVGFDFLPDWPSVFFHKELRLVLVIYVDDFKLAGPKISMERGWKLLGENIKLEEARPIGRYLGCLHVPSVVRVRGEFDPRREWMRDGSNKKEPPKFHEPLGDQDERELQIMKYDMSDFMRQCVIRYQELCAEAYPKALEKAKTPYLDETKGEFDENPVDEGLNKVMGIPTYQVDETPGVLKEHAPAVLMKILYGARVARYDLLRPVQSLASKLTKWTKLCDKALHRLVSYIDQTADTCLYGWVGDAMEKIKLVLCCDADLASDRNDHKSTSGVYLALQGPSTFVPIAAYCRKQTSISKSTPEAEVVALHDGITKQGIPGLVSPKIIRLQSESSYQGRTRT